MGDQAKTLKPMPNPQPTSEFAVHGHHLVRRLRTYCQVPASADRARAGVTRVKAQRFDEPLEQGLVAREEGERQTKKDRSRQRQ
jgi:hypothetical protein